VTLSAPSSWVPNRCAFPLKWAQRLADLIPGTTKLAILNVARMHVPDYRADKFVPLLQQHWARDCE
jgi:hypothetical protein